MKALLVVGSSGHAGAVLEAIELQAQYEVIGLIDSFAPKGCRKHGYPVFGTPEEAVDLAHTSSCVNFFVAIGDNWVRWNIVSKLRAAIPQIEFPIVLHPSVLISRSAHVGPGTVMMAASLAANNARIGEGCIVNTASVVNHDCRMDDYASISGGVNLGGASIIGARTSIGVGSTVREKVTIGKDSVVGAGSVVLDNVPNSSVAYGVPARVVRSREQNERYMR